MPIQRLSLSLGLGLLACGTAYATYASDPTLAGWTPVITMWGGDTGTAVSRLDSVVHALSAAIHNHEIDAFTQAFIDGVLDELENFDLNGLYELLPDERDGGRELNVKGVLSGNRYLIGRAEPKSPYFVSMNGPRSGLADMSLFVHAEQRETKAHDNLFLHGSAGLGVGPLSFRALAEAQRELLRMVTTGTPTAQGEPLAKSGLAREAVRETNPGLGDEDLDALALLFDAYPKLARALTVLGRVEDVRTKQQDGYYHITTRLRAEPKRMAARYPALAKHATKLKDVLHATARLVDGRGRNLVRASVDSEELRASVELYVRDGLVLPFDDNRVYEDEPVDPLANTLQHARVLVNARVNMLGIVVHAKSLRMDADIEAHDSYVSVDARMNTVPNLKVEGRALGMFAPGFLDLFIPSNIQEISEEFFRVLAKGNDKKGLHGHAELGAKNFGEPAAISGSASAEIMDTFLVKLAGGLVASRLMIDEKEKDEAIKLAAHLLDAFKADFASFKQRAAR
jgi:hypothetical protein